MKKLLTAGLAVSALLTAQTGAALADTESAPGLMKKLGPALEYVAKQSATAASAEGLSARSARRNEMGMAGPNNEVMVAKVTPDGYVMLDAIASGSADDLAVTIESLGGKDVSSYGRVVSAKVPADRLSDLAASGYLAFARPVFAETNVGLVDSQGDRSMRTDEIRNDFGLDGTGLTIGILSDSFACDPGSLNAAGVYTTPAEDAANGDIPPDVVILSDFLDQSTCIDEGRGMAQLIYDVLPGSKMVFHSAFNGEADFAEGIIELAEAGADVIVDDIIYFTEPMFQDGIIAQAADQVAEWGIPYFSSNGNRARDAFETDYRPVNTTVDTINGIWHDFDDGPGTDPLASFTLDGSLQTNLTFQWDSPNFSASGAPGAQNDVDVIMFDSNGVQVADCFPGGGPLVVPPNGLCQFQFTNGGVPIDGGAGGDAIELVSLVDFIGGQEVQLGFLTESGNAPGFIKFVIFGGGFAASEITIDAPSGFGHNNAAGAEGVGAAAFYFTEEFIGDPNTNTLRAGAGEPECVPACLNDFSSAGGTPILFDKEGNRLAAPEIRLKPGVTGPDGTNTSFFFNDTSRDDDDGDGVFQSGEPGEFPNFFGTSAAAPHVASLVAQLIDAEGTQVRTTRGRSNKEFFRVCRLIKQFPGRKNGVSQTLPKNTALKRLRDGKVLLRPCEATEPLDLYQVVRDTAQDMTVRASNATGATVATLPVGFDFDSGFGFVDAVAALESFLDGDDYDDEYDDDDDDDDDDD
ncbi:MAG: S8 family peptidase [Hyphococcus sp.]